MSATFRRLGNVLAVAATVIVVGVARYDLAAAATISNADTKPYTVSIIANSRKRDVKLEPGGKLEKVCTDGCLLRIDGDAAREFVLEGSERVSIEDGLVYYDGEVPKETKPAQPGAK